MKGAISNSVYGLLALVVFPCGAQTMKQTSALPIEVTTSPQSTTAGSPVSIGGQTVAFGAQPSVTITVTPPKGVPTTVKASVNSGGAFNASYRQTDNPGKYQVKTMGPDGKGFAQTSFTIVALGDMNQAVSDEAQLAQKTASKQLARFKAMIDALPVSPPKAQVQQRISQLQQKIDQAGPSVNDLPPLLDQLAQLRGKITQKPLQDRFDQVSIKLGSYLEEARMEVPRLDRELSTYTHENLVCDQVDHVTEGFKLLSVLLNFVASPFNILVNFAKDLDADFASSFVSQPSLQLTTSTLVKNINSPHQLIAGLPTFAADLSAFISDQVFSAYCERFAGPIEGRMEALFEHEGHMWWTYSFDLKGRVVLRYPKNSPSGTPIRLSGQMEGLGTNFKMWEDALPVLYPKLMQGSVLFHMTKLPWFNSALSGALLANAIKEGSAFSAQMPNAFYFPVEGDLLENDMVLRLGGKQIDFEDKTADAFYFIASPYTLLQPIVTFALPFKGARFAIGRALNDAPSHLDVKVTKKVMIVEHEYDEKHENGDTHGFYTLKLKACNPGCS
jgi:hypothetical protein